PWVIDYEPDHITFSRATGTLPGLPANAGVGGLAPTAYFPSFSIEFRPELNYTLVPASATIDAFPVNGHVYGPSPGNTCLSVASSNLVVYTCSNCTTVTYTATAVDTCCSNITLVYNPPETNCFPLNSTTPVTVTAYDACGNASAPESFTV